MTKAADETPTKLPLRRPPVRNPSCCRRGALPTTSLVDSAAVFRRASRLCRRSPPRTMCLLGGLLLRLMLTGNHRVSDPPPLAAVGGTATAVRSTAQTFWTASLSAVRAPRPPLLAPRQPGPPKLRDTAARALRMLLSQTRTRTTATRACGDDHCRGRGGRGKNDLGRRGLRGPNAGGPNAGRTGARGRDKRRRDGRKRDGQDGHVAACGTAADALPGPSPRGHARPR